MSPIALHFWIHVNLVTQWKKQLLERAAPVLTREGKNTPLPDDSKLFELDEQIGRFTPRNANVSSGAYPAPWRSLLTSHATRSIAS
jgi:hypothetical protein